MGVIRGILAVVVGTLLFTSVLAGGILLTISSSLKYENVREGLTPVIKDMISGQTGGEIESQVSFMKTHCNQSLEYIFEYENYSISIPCEVIANGTQAVIDYGVEKAIEQTYYQEYDCDFTDCFKQDELPLFLISEHSQKYFNSKFYIVLGFGLLLTILLFIIIQKKSGLPLMLGIFFVVSSLVIWKIPILIAKPFGEAAESLLNIFFSSSYSVFIKMLVIGIILIVTGIILKIMGVGIKINGFFSRLRGKSADEKKKENSKKKK